MLVIRLTRVGKKNSPAYRVVVADKQKAVKRKFIEILGHYNPIMKPKELVIKKDRALYWIGLGAQPSATVNNLMVDLKILDKKINKVYARKKEEAKAEEVAVEPKTEEPAAVTETPTEEIAKTEAVEEAPTEDVKETEPDETKSDEEIAPAENVEEETVE